MEQTKEKKYIVGSILCGLLSAFGIAASVVSLIGGERILSDCAQLILLILIGCYALIGYKKPHGNLLKYIILARAALVTTVFPTWAHVGDSIAIVSQSLEIGLLCYIAGRLNKVKENTVLMMIVVVCIVIGTVSGVKVGAFTIGVFSPLIIWLDICVAYFLRYKEHREAGLEDAPKSK